MLRNDRKPITPVAPVGMEVVFLYECPYCSRRVPVLAPGKPVMAQCDACGKPFPILPVDGYSIDFMRLIFAGGPAAVDPDFI